MGAKIILNFCLAAILTVGLSGCSSKGQPGENKNQQEQAEDQQIREKVAKATRKAKEDSKIVAQKADQAAKDLGHKAKVVKQGVQEGWNGDASQLVNLNSASQADLQELPGISQKDAQRIIHGRPYKSKDELLDRRIIPRVEFQKIEGRITVK